MSVGELSSLEEDDRLREGSQSKIGESGLGLIWIILVVLVER